MLNKKWGCKSMDATSVQRERTATIWLLVVSVRSSRCLTVFTVLLTDVGALELENFRKYLFLFVRNRSSNDESDSCVHSTFSYLYAYTSKIPFSLWLADCASREYNNLCYVTSAYITAWRLKRKFDWSGPLFKPTSFVNVVGVCQNMYNEKRKDLSEIIMKNNNIFKKYNYYYLYI